MFDSDDSLFHVILAQCHPHPKGENTGRRQNVQTMVHIKTKWIHLLNRCKGGADQGCRHIGATLFELDDFLSSERSAVTSLPAYWNPKRTPQSRSLHFLEVKLSHSTGLGSKRDMAPYDDSWIDSFDPSKEKIFLPRIKSTLPKN